MKQTILVAGFTSFILGYSGISYGHSAGAVLGASGTNPHATGLAAITCFDDGNGAAAKLIVEVQDQSEPVEGSYINAQIYKGIKATSTTDLFPGDAEYSDTIALEGGSGVYWLILNKTSAEPKQFDIVYHCVTEDDVHTGTDTVVRQFQ